MSLLLWARVVELNICGSYARYCSCCWL